MDSAVCTTNAVLCIITLYCVPSLCRLRLQTCAPQYNSDRPPVRPQALAPNTGGYGIKRNRRGGHQGSMDPAPARAALRPRHAMSRWTGGWGTNGNRVGSSAGRGRGRAPTRGAHADTQGIGKRAGQLPRDDNMPNLAEGCSDRPSPGQRRRKSGQTGQTLAKPGPKLSNLGTNAPDVRRTRPKRTRMWRLWCDVAPSLTRCDPDSAKFG